MRGHPGRNHDLLTDTDGIAGKSNRLLFRHGKPAFLGNPFGDGGQSVGIEGCRQIEQLPAAEGTKTGIEMVKPAVDKLERNNFALKDFAQPRK